MGPQSGGGRDLKQSIETRTTTGIRMLKIAVLGTGLIGSVHAKNVARHPGAELAAVYDVNVEFAKRAAATTGTKVAADVAEIFDNPEI
jgi:myo-inositol 2-dehydrogenase/D-chiro-inositol 1-dehydrogenase